VAFVLKTTMNTSLFENEKQVRRLVANTGLMVTPLCIGCAPLGDMPDTFAYSVAESQALDTVRAIFNSDINFLDTAYSYGDGESERRIGLVLKEYGGKVPEGYVLASKADRNLQTGDFSGAQMRKSVERSLKLLGLNSIDIMHLHDPETTTYENVMSKGGPLEVLQQMQSEGLIKHLGVAGGPIDMEIKYVETGAFSMVITHNRYTLLNRVAEPLLEAAHKRGVAVFNAAPYGSGILAKGPSAYPRFAYREADAEMVERAFKLEAVCKKHEVPLAAAALQFSLRDPRITSTIIGMSKPERIQQTIDLAKMPIPETLWAELDAAAPPINKEL
jgi:D-threo-aldose 1-dehydrogenase